MSTETLFSSFIQSVLIGVVNSLSLRDCSPIVPYKTWEENVLPFSGSQVLETIRDYAQLRNSYKRELRTQPALLFVQAGLKNLEWMPTLQEQQLERIGSDLRRALWSPVRDIDRIWLTSRLAISQEAVQRQGILDPDFALISPVIQSEILHSCGLRKDSKHVQCQVCSSLVLLPILKSKSYSCALWDTHLDFMSIFKTPWNKIYRMRCNNCQNEEKVLVRNTITNMPASLFWVKIAQSPCEWMAAWNVLHVWGMCSLDVVIWYSVESLLFLPANCPSSPCWMLLYQYNGSWWQKYSCESEAERVTIPAASDLKTLLNCLHLHQQELICTWKLDSLSFRRSP